MSHFYADLQGNRGPTSRGGSKISSISSHTRGWDSGINVFGYYDEVKKQDVFIVSATAGSGRKHNEVEIGRLYEENGKLVFTPSTSFKHLTKPAKTKA